MIATPPLASRPITATTSITSALGSVPDQACQAVLASTQIPSSPRLKPFSSAARARQASAKPATLRLIA